MSMRCLSSSLLAATWLTIALTSCRTAGSRGTEELRSSVERYYEVLSARDWPAFREQFWPAATLTTVWQAPGLDRPMVVTTTIDEFLAHTAEGPGARPVFGQHLQAAEVTVLDHVATVWARYEAVFGVPDALVRWQGIDTFTWLKHDGHWRIVSIAYQSDGPAP